jgi:hypothetical protein
MVPLRLAESFGPVFVKMKVFASPYEERAVAAVSRLSYEPGQGGLPCESSPEMLASGEGPSSGIGSSCPLWLTLYNTARRWRLALPNLVGVVMAEAKWTVSLHFFFSSGCNGEPSQFGQSPIEENVMSKAA